MYGVPTNTNGVNRLPRADLSAPSSPIASLGRTAGNALVSAFALAIALKVVDLAFAAVTKPRAPQPQRHPEHVGV